MQLDFNDYRRLLNFDHNYYYYYYCFPIKSFQRKTFLEIRFYYFRVVFICNIIKFITVLLPDFIRRIPPISWATQRMHYNKSKLWNLLRWPYHCVRTVSFRVANERINLLLPVTRIYMVSTLLFEWKSFAYNYVRMLCLYNKNCKTFFKNKLFFIMQKNKCIKILLYFCSNYEVKHIMIIKDTL